MSISTTGGDEGKTSLIGGERVSKADPRIAAYGAIDELVSQMGMARSICELAEVRELTKKIQKELFTVSSALSGGAAVSASLVEALTAEVHRIESMEGMLDDWALPGEHPASAAFDLARVVCRRAERQVVSLLDAGQAVGPNVIAYLNRLSDLLWLLGRWVEKSAGVDASLRDGKRRGPRWSRAW